MASQYSLQQHQQPPRVPMIRTPSSSSMDGMSNPSHPIQSPTYQTGPNAAGHGQQQQQQQNGQGQQQQQQQQQNGQGQGQDPQSAQGQAPPQMNLAGVLHYLQSEWRRWERDRNEWEIERAEMRARIALLEGERRSAENLKTDLMRRVKILEFALRQERSKTLNSRSFNPLQITTSTAAAAAAAGLPAAKLAGIVGGEGEKVVNGFGSGSQKGEQQGSGGSSSPKSEGSNLPPSESNAKGSRHPNGNVPHPRTASLHPAAAGSVSGSSSHVASQKGLGISGENPWKNSIVAPPRDMKSRAKSREYLKQCLQEISYLTSPAALNPLPTRLPLTLSIPSSLDGEASNIHPTLEVEPRPKKVLSDAPIPSSLPSKSQPPASETESAPQPVSDVNASDVKEGRSSTSPAEESPSQTRPIPQSQITAQDENERILTAIYRPESKDAWKEALRAAGEKADQSRRPSSQSSGQSGGSDAGDQEIDANIKPGQEETLQAMPTYKSSFTWKPSRQLKSHLDLVNGICFGPEGSLVSVSSDCTVKVWRADMTALASGKTSSVPTELEPQATFRGHTAPVTSVCVSSSRSLIFSGSMDSTIRVWHMPPPPPNHDTYSAYDDSLCGPVLVGHTDGVWALSIVPSAEEAEGYLVSASADGSCKVWSLTEESGFPLLSSWSYDGAGSQERSETEATEAPVPVSIAPNYSDLQKVLVGYNNGVIKAFDLRSGVVAMKCASADRVTDGVPVPTLNQVICNPSVPIIASAMSDGTVRLYNSDNGKEIDTLKAHSEAVNSLDLDPTSASILITCGDDCSVKLWRIPLDSSAGEDDENKATCIQEWTLHRRKSDQGVMCVKFHEDLALLASGGADGVVRIYVKSSVGA